MAEPLQVADINAVITKSNELGIALKTMEAQIIDLMDSLIEYQRSLVGLYRED